MKKIEPISFREREREREREIMPVSQPLRRCCVLSLRNYRSVDNVACTTYVCTLGNLFLRGACVSPRSRAIGINENRYIIIICPLRRLYACMIERCRIELEYVLHLI